MFTLTMGAKSAVSLRPGELVTATVLRLDDDAHAVVRIKNADLEVQTDVPLKTGETLTLRVERQENTVFLKLSGRATDEATSLKNAVLAALNKYEGLGSVTEGMTRLVDALNALPNAVRQSLPEIDIITRFLLQLDSLSGATLRNAVENGGVFFETKLRVLALGMEADGGGAYIEAGRIIAGDLKASLLRLKDAFLSPAVLEHVRGRVNSDALIGALNTVLRNIEYYQLQSKLTDTLQYFLPLVWKQLRDGELILREYDTGKPGERTYACTVNLDLERAGKVQASLLKQNGVVHVGCAAENAGFVGVLESGLDLLRERFNNAGLRAGQFTVRHRARLNFDDFQPDGLSIRI